MPSHHAQQPDPVNTDPGTLSKGAAVNSLARIRIVLIGTTHAGNIGSTARAMKNMGLSRLMLVNPKRFPDHEATALASGADDLLERAQVCADLDEALVGCRLVAGTSARLRSVSWPQLTPRECAARMISELGEMAEGEEVALLFGRERMGLTNEELDRCNFLVCIPANPEYSSLNLAQAVQLLSYELRLAALEAAPTEVPAVEVEELATAEVMEGFFGHLFQAMEEVGFADPARSEKLQRRLRRLFLRARPALQEINILRGFLSATQGRKSMRRER